MTDRPKLTSHSRDEGLDSGRERVSRAAYELFSREGVRAVGVDAVIARAGTAKMTLYRNFPSKDDLIIEFLRRREQLWTRDWLEAESTRRGQTPREQLLAIFDVFSEWFTRPDFEGCSFLTTMIEITDRENPVHQAAVGHLANIRGYIGKLAAEAGVGDTDSFARQWHILMKGAIMAAHEGDTKAAARARELGELLLKQHGCLPAGDPVSWWYRVSWWRRQGARTFRRGHPAAYPGSADAELLGRLPGPLDPVGDLLERRVAGEVRRSVAGLLIDAERREPAVIG
jgi:AcrR family transcriptional regulator